MGDTRFVRIHGRIVPIHTGAGAKRANMAEGKKQLTKVGNGLKKQAIHKANDSYNHDLNPNQQQVVKKGLHVFQSVGTGAGLMAGAVAALGGIKLGKAGIDAADSAIQAYKGKADEAKVKYTAIGLSGAYAATLGGVGAAVMHKKVGSAERGLGFLNKHGSYSSLQDKTKLLKHLKNVKMGRIGFTAALVGGAAAAIVGGIGRAKAAKHQNRAETLKGISSAVKQFVGSK